MEAIGLMSHMRESCKLKIVSFEKFRIAKSCKHLDKSVIALSVVGGLVALVLVTLMVLAFVDIRRYENLLKSVCIASRIVKSKSNYSDGPSKKETSIPNV